MRDARYHLDALVKLFRLPKGEARLSAWRQGMATLAAQTAEKHPVPLEGANPQALQKSVNVAFSEGYVDRLDWLSPPTAASALYELAAALPVGKERREIGRRVLQRVHQGDAETFIALAERLALGTRHGLKGAAIRARTTLALELPIGSVRGADSLALALISRPELQRTWLEEASTGSLPSRRLAAKILDRAAREIIQRSSQDSTSIASLFEQSSLRSAWKRLLSDREPLVWRYVASARGLLARHLPELEEEITRDLESTLTPTEWRRASASLAAMIAVDPHGAANRCRHVLKGEVFRRDPGVASAMVLGLSRAAEIEPDAAQSLLVELIEAGGIDTVSALVELRNERLDRQLGARAAQVAQAYCRQSRLIDSPDDGRVALAKILESELSHDRPQPLSLRGSLETALHAFIEQGAHAAHIQAYGVLQVLDSVFENLESTDLSTSSGRQQAFVALREIDRSLLESSILPALLLLGAKTDAAVLEPIDNYFERLTEWLSHHEADFLSDNSQLEHPTLRIHRLRSMLHLVDTDIATVQERGSGQRDRCLKMARLLLYRVSADVPTPLRRVVAASAARACDALLREEIGELSDVLVLIVDNVRDVEDLRTMAEAAMDPTMVRVLEGYAKLVGVSDARVQRPASRLDALHELVGCLPPVGSPRVEALRAALMAYVCAIEAILPLRSLAKVAGDGESISSFILPLASAAGSLARLTAGARRRLGDWPGEEPPMCTSAIRRVDTGVEHALRGDDTPMRDAISTALATLQDELPVHFAQVADHALSRLVDLPTEEPTVPPLVQSGRSRGSSEAPLPDWMPPSRTIGGFFILRSLGSGAAGSVFVACRVEDRGRQKPPCFALKVPEYGGDVAHTLSESEFLQLFREEAGALLTVPPHANLAKLVTFDAGARPKPILVMELVEGPTLQRLIDTRVLNTTRAMRSLDGIAAGLEVMHRVGVGHLDLKPSNVILRHKKDATSLSVDLDPTSVLPRVSRFPTSGHDQEVSVLVDFGLAGRNLRPGCATASYGAPEVWGHIPKGHEPRSTSADVYAFACLVYETLVGTELFSGSNHLAVLTSHLTHDGLPPPVAKLASLPRLCELAEVLQMALRQDPRQRCTISEMRQSLTRIDLTTLPWPIA